jgi:hypothetical protein
VEETGHDGSWACQRGHSAARPNGEGVSLGAMGDGEAAEPVGERERVGSWDGPACAWLAARERRAGCAAATQRLLAQDVRERGRDGNRWRDGKGGKDI